MTKLNVLRFHFYVVGATKQSHIRCKCKAVLKLLTIYLSFDFFAKNG